MLELHPGYAPDPNVSGDDRASLIMPQIDDDVGDLFAARFGAAWNNGQHAPLKEAPRPELVRHQLRDRQPRHDHGPATPVN